MTGSSRTFAVLLLAPQLLLGCGTIEAPPLMTDQLETAAVTNLHARCDAVSPSTRIAATDRRPLTAIDLGTITLPDEIARVRDLVGPTADSILTVLDSRNAQLARIDVSGRLHARFSQRGEGPGDLSFPPPTTPAGSRLAMVGRGQLLVADRRSLKAFDASGHPRWDRRVSSWPEGMNSGFHLASLDDSTVVFSTSGKFLLSDSTRSERTRMTLFTVTARDEPPTPRFTLENDWVLLPTIGRGFPEHRPYRDEFRQAWDARDGTIAIISYRAFRVCFFDADGSIAAAHELSLTPSPIDDDEKQRVLTEAFGRIHDRPLPFIGRTARELYADKWPDAMPRYTDILLGTDRRAWVFRRISATSVAVDIFDPDRGYIGTFDPPLGRLPLRVGVGGAIVADNGEMLLRRYRVVIERP